MEILNETPKVIKLLLKITLYATIYMCVVEERIESPTGHNDYPRSRTINFERKTKQANEIFNYQLTSTFVHIVSYSN